MKVIDIAYEGKLLPPVQDVLLAVLEHYGIEEVNEYKIGSKNPLLVLGKLPAVLPEKYAKTVSQKQLLAKAGTLTELRMAVELLVYPPAFPEMKYKLIERAGQGSTTAFRNARKRGVVVLDIETGGSIDLMLPDETWLISLAINDGESITVFSEEWLAQKENLEELKRFLLSGVKLIAHNMKFDFRTLSAILGIKIKGHLDTMLLMHSLNPAFSTYKLKELAEIIFGVPDWDTAAKEYVKGKYKTIPEGYPQELWDKYGPNVPVGYEAIPRKLLYEYNAYDVFYTWYLKEYLLARATPDNIRVALHEYRMANFFQDVEAYGEAIDLDKLSYLEEFLVGEKERVTQELRAMVDSDTFNPNSPPQVKQVFESIGVKLPGTAEQVLIDARPTLPKTAQTFVDNLLEFRGISKSYGTYVKGIRERLHDGIIHSTFNVHGTNTGRLSSSNPNVQNFPRDPTYRNLITSRDPEERTLVEVDYSQAELRVMACLAEDDYLISLFQPGMPDFFDSLMPTAFPRIDLPKLDATQKKDKRAKLKATVYGLSYGRKEVAIAKSLDMPVPEAKSIVTNYFSAAPQFYEWRKWVESVALDPNDNLVTPFGRYFQSEIVTTRNKQNVVNSALAFLPQSTASDLCVVAAMRVHEWLPQYDAHIIATVHDAILIDCPKKYAKMIAERVQAEMKRSGDDIFHGVVPFDTDFEIVPSWGWKAPKIEAD